MYFSSRTFLQELVEFVCKIKGSMKESKYSGYLM